MTSSNVRGRRGYLAADVGGDPVVVRSVTRLWRRHVLAPILALAVCAFAAGPASAATSAAASAGQPKLAFWIETSNNGIFDDTTLKFFANHASIMVLNAQLDASDGAPSYAQVVAREHALNPQLPVLLYFWATRVYRGARTGNFITKNLPNRPDLLFRNPVNGELMRGPKLSFGNVESNEYLQWVSDGIVNALRITGDDGVASDVSDREPFPQLCSGKPVSWRVACKNYAVGVDNLFIKIRSTIEPKLVIFNGLWGDRPGRVATQEPLLNYTDGAAIEWFGRIQSLPIPIFDVGILPYLQVIERHPDKYFLVFARGSTGYTSYEADYLWQRYLYAAYLMVARPNTRFRYLSTFQSVSTGRAYMFTLYDDVATKIGVPSGPYQSNGNLYSRKFSKGLALFVPTSGKPVSYGLSGTLYSEDGQPHSGRIQVTPGDGLVLFDQWPPAHPFSVAFSNAAASNLGLPASGVVTPSAGGVSYLAMQALPPAARLGQHDILLSPIKTMHPSLGLQIKLRTKDPSASLQVVAEVDDAASKAVQAVTVLDAGACPVKAEPTVHIAFRWPRSTLEFPQGCVSHFLKADGQWHTYTIPATGVLPSNLTTRRWEYVRFNGAIDLRSILQAAST